MTNKDIAKAFDKLAKMMELHGENAFRTRSYSSAYITLRKQTELLIDMSLEQLNSIKGVGKAVAEKIVELRETGTIQKYQAYVDKTPEGIVEMLNIKGFGPKKIKTIWNELGITTIGELLYACNENRLIELKGFGAKTQQNLKAQLEYFLDSKGKYLYAYIIDEAKELVSNLSELFPDEKISLCGKLRRKLPVVEAIELVTTIDLATIDTTKIEHLERGDNGFVFHAYPCVIHHVSNENFTKELFIRSASESFLEAFGNIECEADEQAIFASKNLHFIPVELRESPHVITEAEKNPLPKLITDADLRGVIHNHSTYSDGIHTLKEMAEHTRESGYEYLVMSDHSKAAFYANGLSEERCIQQMNEIDLLNAGYSDFKIFKSIECDILNDGRLDYDDDFLKEFDLVIASVHSNLKMDKAKATARIIKAVEHPSTHILGHMTGRLLLSREGYPLDFEKVIDACIANDVVLELNANPVRLDIDWTWIPYVLERGGIISINPDAHNKAHIHFMKYGVAVARKGGLTAENCLNAKNLSEFQNWVDGLA